MRRDVGDDRRRACRGVPRRLPGHRGARAPAPDRPRIRPRPVRRRCRRTIALVRTGGDVLCFLPGALEISRTIGEMRAPAWTGVEIAAAPRVARAGRRRIARFSRHHGAASLWPRTSQRRRSQSLVSRPSSTRGFRRSRGTTRTAASIAWRWSASPPTAAEQRAGRAGRTGPGIVDSRYGTPPTGSGRTASRRFSAWISSGALLDIVAWGGDPRTTRLVRAAARGCHRHGGGAARTAWARARR